MVHRACSIPMSEENFHNEIMFIENVARENGFKTDFLRGMIQRHKRNIHKNNITTLASEKERTLRHVGMTFFPQVTERMKNVFNAHGLSMAYRSNNKIKNGLVSTKDKIERNDRAGVYEARCASKNCNKVYVGQTGRAANVRFNEHLKHIERKEISKSAIAEHVIKKKHKISRENFHLVKEASGFHRLNTIEAIQIHKNKENALNRNDGITQSILYDLCV